MADDTTRERFTLKRWSQRKLAAAREAPAPVPPTVGAAPPPAPVATTTPAAPETAAPAALPPIESLTFDADFTAFMKPDVDPALKRAALKMLVRDPRFNVMDGLDVYIDDYSKFEPLDAETARSLVSARYIFDPPKTRVNDRGEVEDVPPDEEAEAKAGEEAQAEAPPALASEADATTIPAPEVAPDAVTADPLPEAPKDDATR